MGKKALSTIGRDPQYSKLILSLLRALGIGDEDLPSETTLYVMVCTGISAAGLLYYHWRQKRLLKELLIAEAKLQFLEERLLVPSEDSREIRIFMDGAFDLLHFGHMNAFRLGKSLGTRLIVGINSDESIRTCKGEPFMNDQERLTMVSACKFVDEVVPGCPYIMNKEYLDYVIREYKIDYVIHGDDPCIVDGKDVYETAKAAGKYRSIPRTEGVSTTDIMGRMLLMNKEHHYSSGNIIDEPSHMKDYAQQIGRKSKFLTTSRLLKLFSSGLEEPPTGARIIYIDGSWDLFHPGHVAVLKAARERGDYLIVGIHSDSIVNETQGMNLPLMNLHERVLSVLGCRHVNDILIDAPYILSSDMLASLKIDEVAYDRQTMNPDEVLERYGLANDAGLLWPLDVACSFNMGKIIRRIKDNQSVFQDRFRKKMEKEKEFYETKYNSSQNNLIN